MVQEMENLFESLLNNDSFEQLNYSFKSSTSKRLLLGILILMAVNNASSLSPAQRLVNSAGNASLGPKAFKDFACKFLLSKGVRQNLFDELCSLYDNFKMKDRVCELIRRCAPEIVSPCAMLKELRKRYTNEAICATHIFLIFTAYMDAPSKNKYFDTYKLLAEDYYIEPIEDKPIFELLLLCIENIHYVQDASEFAVKTSKKYKSSSLKNLTAHYKSYSSGSPTKFESELFASLNPPDLAKNPYTALYNYSPTYHEEKFENSYLLHRVMDHIISKEPKNILFVDPGLRFAHVWNSIAPIETTYAWPSFDVMECMSDGPPNIHSDNIARLILNQNKQFDFVVLYNRADHEFSNCPVGAVTSLLADDGSILAIVPEKDLNTNSIIRFQNSRGNKILYIDNIVLFPPELITPRNAPADSLPRVLAQMSFAPHADSPPTKMRSRQYYLRTKTITNKKGGTISQYQYSYLIPSKEVHITYDSLKRLNEDGISLRALQREIKDNVITKRRSPPEEIFITNEISFFYTQTFLKAENQYRIHAYICEPYTIKQQKRYKKRYGKKILLRGNTTDQVHYYSSIDRKAVEADIIHGLFKEIYASPELQEKLVGFRPLCDVSLKTFYLLNKGKLERYHKSADAKHPKRIYNNLREVFCEMKRYDNQFKEEAVRLAQEIGTRRAAEQLGISYHTLSGWRRSKQAHGAGAFVGSGRSYSIATGLTPREKELQRENDELRRANEILKDALGFFAKDRKK